MTAMAVPKSRAERVGKRVIGTFFLRMTIKSRYAAIANHSHIQGQIAESIMKKSHEQLPLIASVA